MASDDNLLPVKLSFLSQFSRETKIKEKKQTSISPLIKWIKYVPFLIDFSISTFPSLDFFSFVISKLPFCFSPSWAILSSALCTLYSSAIGPFLCVRSTVGVRDINSIYMSQGWPGNCKWHCVKTYFSPTGHLMTGFVWSRLHVKKSAGTLTRWWGQRPLRRGGWPRWTEDALCHHRYRYISGDASTGHW